LQFLGRKIGWAAERGHVAESELRQATNTGREGDSGKVHIVLRVARNIEVGVELCSLRIDAVVAEPEFVDQGRFEDVGPTDGYAAVGVLFDAAEEAAAIGNAAKVPGMVLG